MSGSDTSVVGSSVPRREDDRLLAGQGQFVADIGLGAQHLAFVRADVAAADIDEIAVNSARELPGVLAVLTIDELGLVSNHIAPLHTPDPSFAAEVSFEMAEQRLALMARDQIHYVGQIVAAVVAIDRYVAEDAAELVEVRRTARPAIVGIEDALASGAPIVHEHLPDNVAASLEYEFGDPNASHGDVAVTAHGTYRVGRHGAAPLECRGVVARLDGVNGVDVWTSTQIPHMVRRGICAATGWDSTSVRIHVPDVGGGFGTKANVYPEEVLVPTIAQLLGRDLVWVEDRQEHLTAAAQGRDQVHHISLSVDSVGRILSIEDDFTVNAGAGSLWVAGIVANTSVHLLGPYRIPAGRISGRAVFSNKATVAQYRGAGRPESAFALERSLDEAARQLGISRTEIRQANLLTAEDLPYARPIPYRDGVPIVYDGGDFRRCFDEVLAILPQSEVDAERRRHPNLRVGHGVACYIEATGRGPYETARLALDDNGRITVMTGAASAGQGHETSFAQVAAQYLGVALECVRVRRTDTGTLPHGIGSFGSRSAVLAGNAIVKGAKALIVAAAERFALAHGLAPDAVTYRDRRFHGAGNSADWSDIAAFSGPGGPLEGEASLVVAELYRCETVTWTMGAHAAIVGVNPDNGIVRVLRYAIAHEGGVEINPLIVEGQILGGFAQGLGGALYEEFGYTDDGGPTSTTFAEYGMPGSCEVPDVSIRHLGIPTANPLGVRGAGESGTIAVAAALAAGVDHAAGTSIRETPITPRSVWATMRQGGAS